MRATQSAEPAESALRVAGLTSRKAQLEATLAAANAQRNEALAIETKVSLKQIEIKLIRETVAAQIAEQRGKIEQAKIQIEEVRRQKEVNQTKIIELETTIKLAEAAIVAARARGEHVSVLESEITQLRENTYQKGLNASGSRNTADALGGEADGRHQNADAIERENEALERRQRLGGGGGGGGGGKMPLTNAGNVQKAENMIPVDVAFKLMESRGGEGMSEEEIRKGIEQATAAYRDMEAVRRLSPGVASTEYIQSTTALMNAANIAKQRLSAGRMRTKPDANDRTDRRDPLEQPAAEQQSRDDSAGSSRTVTINIGGRTTSIGVASQSDSDALVALLRQLETASRSAAA
jgi:hypothetical protein